MRPRMPRYKPAQRNGVFIPVVFDEQIQPGTCEFASARGYPSLTMSPKRYSHEGLAPHKLAAMLGAHPLLERTVKCRLRLQR